MDFAAGTGCNHVSPWFGHDGWDYILQMDYLKAYDWIIEGLCECVDHTDKGHPRDRVSAVWSLPRQEPIACRRNRPNHGGRGVGQFGR